MRDLHIKYAYTRRSAGIDKYFNEINKQEMLTVDQEVEISRRAALGDTNAINQLVKANLRFVVSVAKQYHDPGMELQDLVQAGNIGCMEAARRFDPTRGFKFISYAVWWIRQRILLEVHNKRMIRLPDNKRAKISLVKKQIEKINQQIQNNDFSTVDFPTVDISEVSRYLSDPLSKQDAGDTYEDMLSMEGAEIIEEKLMKESLHKALVDILNRYLDSREAFVIKNHFGIDTTPILLEDIGSQIGVTRERVRQIQNNALKKLRKHPEIKQFWD